MIETQGELFIDVQKSGHLVKYSSPPFRLLGTEEVGARAGVVLVPDRECGSGCFMFIAAGGDLLLEYDMEEGPARRLRRGGGVGVGGVGVIVVVQVGGCRGEVWRDTRPQGLPFLHACPVLGLLPTVHLRCPLLASCIS